MWHSDLRPRHLRVKSAHGPRETWQGGLWAHHRDLLCWVRDTNEYPHVVTAGFRDAISRSQPSAHSRLFYVAVLSLPQMKVLRPAHLPLLFLPVGSV